MKPHANNRGFSLTEVLMAVGTLGIGMIFVASVFPVAIHFSTVATERTIAAIAADEAFAKIRLYDVNSAVLAVDSQVIFENATPSFAFLFDNNFDDFAYPSANMSTKPKQYYWTALCRLAAPRNIQVTVFVCRKAGQATRFRDPADPLNPSLSFPRPLPVQISVQQSGLPEELSVSPDSDMKVLINDGYTIIENTTGQIYRVLERYAQQDDTILLDQDWRGGDSVWVVPPPASGGRYPCIGVYQKVIRF